MDALAPFKASVAEFAAACEAAQRGLKAQADMADNIVAAVEARKSAHRMWSQFTPPEGRP